MLGTTKGSSVRWLMERFALVFAVPLLVLTVGSAQPSALAITALVAIALTAVISVRYAAVLLQAAEIRIGRRAREHREALTFAPAPRHPNTRGRTRSRAPSRPVAVA
jgi:hypothetical protein